LGDRIGCVGHPIKIASNSEKCLTRSVGFYMCGNRAEFFGVAPTVPCPAHWNALAHPDPRWLQRAYQKYQGRECWNV